MSDHFIWFGQLLAAAGLGINEEDALRYGLSGVMNMTIGHALQYNT